MKESTILEVVNAVMDPLLVGDHQCLATLREQYRDADVSTNAKRFPTSTSASRCERTSAVPLSLMTFT